MESAVNVDVQNKNGDTPLHLAIKQRQLECCRQLLRYGASPTVRNSAGYTARDTARMIFPQHRTMFSDSLFSLLGEDTNPPHNVQSRHSKAKYDQSSVLPQPRMQKSHSSSSLRLEIPKQQLSQAPKRKSSSARIIYPSGNTKSSDETASSGDDSSTDSGNSGGWGIGNFLYRTTLRLVGIKDAAKSDESEAVSL